MPTWRPDRNLGGHARSKAGPSGHAKANGNKPKFKGKVSSWKSKVGPVKGRRNDQWLIVVGLDLAGLLIQVGKGVS